MSLDPDQLSLLRSFARDTKGFRCTNAQATALAEAISGALAEIARLTASAMPATVPAAPLSVPAKEKLDPLDAALAAEGYRRTSGSGWYVTVMVNGEPVKAWATDELLA